MQFRMLGPVEAEDEQTGLRILPTGAKQRALLGALLVEAGHSVSVQRLIDELWGEEPPAHADNALHVHVARLRRLLAGPGSRRAGLHAPHPWIVTTSHGYALRPAAAETDAERFRQLTGRARRMLPGDPEQAGETLRRALALWRGPALEGSVLGGICAGQAARLEEQRLTALEMMYDAFLRTGRHWEITGELVELTCEHPVREGFYDLLMVALYRCGRPAEALRVYERARTRMVRELGVGPGPALRGLRESILHHDPALGGTAVVRPPAPATAPPPASGPVRASAPAPGEPDPPADDAVLPLCDEIARLHRRIERLQQEQTRLMRRFDELAAGAGHA